MRKIVKSSIVIDYKEDTEEQKAAYQSWEDATGHKKFSVGKFGGWRCNHCGNEGDEYGPSLKEVPCIQTEKQGN